MIEEEIETRVRMVLAQVEASERSRLIERIRERVMELGWYGSDEYPATALLDRDDVLAILSEDSGD